jgi:hypothetical protein
VDPAVGSKKSRSEIKQVRKVAVVEPTQNISKKPERNESKLAVKLAINVVARSRKTRVQEPSGGAIVSYQAQLAVKRKGLRRREEVKKKAFMNIRPPRRSHEVHARHVSREGKLFFWPRRKSEWQSCEQSKSAENGTGQNLIDKKKRGWRGK